MQSRIKVNRRLRSRTFWAPGGAGLRALSVFVGVWPADERRQGRTVRVDAADRFGPPPRACRYRRCRRESPRARNLARGGSDESWRAVSLVGAEPFDPHTRPPTLSRLVVARTSWQSPGTTLGFNTSHLYRAFDKTCCWHLGRPLCPNCLRGSIADEWPTLQT